MDAWLEEIMVDDDGQEMVAVDYMLYPSVNIPLSYISSTNLLWD